MASARSTRPLQLIAPQPEPDDASSIESIFAPQPDIPTSISFEPQLQLQPQVQIQPQLQTQRVIRRLPLTPEQQRIEQLKEELYVKTADNIVLESKIKRMNLSVRHLIQISADLKEVLLRAGISANAVRAVAEEVGRLDAAIQLQASIVATPLPSEQQPSRGMASSAAPSVASSAPIYASMPPPPPRQPRGPTTLTPLYAATAALTSFGAVPGGASSSSNASLQPPPQRRPRNS